MKIYKIEQTSYAFRSTHTTHNLGGRWVYRGWMPFKRFFLVPESVRDAFMDEMKHCVAQKIRVWEQVKWQEFKVKTGDGEEDYILSVLPDILRKEDPYWAVTPIPRINVKRTRNSHALNWVTGTAKVARFKARHIRETHRNNCITFLPHGQTFYGDEDPEVNPIEWYLQKSSYTEPSTPDVARMMSDVVVHTGDGIVQNICGLCPKFALKIQGKCHFGCEHCDEHLRIFDLKGMYAKLREYDELFAAIPLTAPDTEIFTDGQGTDRTREDHSLRVVARNEREAALGDDS